MSSANPNNVDHVLLEDVQRSPFEKRADGAIEELRGGIGGVPTIVWERAPRREIQKKFQERSDEHSANDDSKADSNPNPTATTGVQSTGTKQAPPPSDKETTGDTLRDATATFWKKADPYFQYFYENTVFLMLMKAADAGSTKVEVRLDEGILKSIHCQFPSGCQANDAQADSNRALLNAVNFCKWVKFNRNVDAIVLKVIPGSFATPSCVAMQFSW